MKQIKKSSVLILLSSAIILLTIISCKKEPTKADVVLKYPTGELLSKYTTIDGKKEGLMTDYYPDGSRKAERWFENDVQVGKTTLYHKSGGVKEVQYYQNGKVHGGDTIFYEDGKPEMLVTFHEGLKDGYVRKWNKEGEVVYEAKYEMEKLVEVKGQRIKPDSLHVRPDTIIK